MTYGSMAPAPMQFPGLMKQPDIGAQGLALMQAALKARGGMPGASPAADTGIPGADGTGAPANPGGGGFMQNMMNGPGMGLLSKLFPQQSAAGGAVPAGPIDPNTGLPVTPDVLAGAAGMGGGPSPTALTGLW